MQIISAPKPQPQVRPWAAMTLAEQALSRLHPVEKFIS
jgi:hypothetical protein